MLTNYTTWVKEFAHGNFDIKVGYFPEDCHPQDCFDDTCFDTNEIARKIDMGLLDWFVARVQVYYDGREMGSSYLGGCLYEDAHKAIEEGLDGYLEDMIAEAVDEAENEAVRMLDKLKEDFLQ